MTKTTSPHCFLVQTDFSLTFVRTVAGSSPARIEAIKEVLLTDTAALAEGARAIFGPNPAKVVCALRPKPRILCLASADHTGSFSGPSGVKQFVGKQSEFCRLPAARVAAVQARDGTAPSSGAWLLDLTSPDGHAESAALLDSLNVEPVRAVSATFLDAGALAAATSAPTWLLEIGALGTNAMLVSRDGVLAANSISLNLDRIGEAVQAELGLKFRGAAIKLFFNSSYDFSESGAKIAARLASSLKTELAALQGSHEAPTSVLCAGLPAAQQWFANQLAAALNLSVWTPDIKTIGVAFAHPEAAPTIAPAWSGLLSLVAAGTDASHSPWQGEWFALDQPDTPARKTQTTTTPATPPTSAKPVTAGKTSSGLRDYPPKPIQTKSEKTKSPSSSNKMIMAIAALLVILLGGGGFYYAHLQSRKADRLATQQAQLKQQLEAEAAKAQRAKQQALTEAEQRKQLEQESARKLAEAEAARKQAEAEARVQLAARLANARGNITITTAPPRAMVTVGNLLPRPSPATFSDVKVGRYPVQITLAQHETAHLEIEVEADRTTDAGIIKLAKLVGAMEITTTPAGTGYEVKPAGVFLIDPNARLTGRTPDTLHDLAPGDYTVTLTRDGWAPHTETVAVARDAMAQVNWVCPNGTATITSVPTGATVFRQGTKLGITPLTLLDQPPGPVSYTLNLPNYAPATVSGRILGGQTVELTSELHTLDHVSQLSEVDERPAVILSVQPEIPYDFRQAGKSARVEIELTVTREGRPKDVVIHSSTAHELNAPCLKAIRQWKFKPATIQGNPVNVRLIVPLNFDTAS